MPVHGVIVRSSQDELHNVTSILRKRQRRRERREKKDKGKGRRERKGRTEEEGRNLPKASVLWFHRQNRPSKPACMLTDEEGLGASPRHMTMLRQTWKTGFQLGT